MTNREIMLELAKEGIRQCLKYAGACSGCPYEKYKYMSTGKACMEVLRDDVLDLLEGEKDD